MTAVYFSVLDGELRIAGGSSPAEWRGRPDGLNVIDLQVTADHQSAVVLLDAPAGSGHVNNLIRIEGDGEISWRGELPTGSPTDCFVGFRLDPDGAVLASTWSGYQVRLSAHSGKLERSDFTK